MTMLASWFGPALFGSVVVVVLAVVGRFSIPKPERVPISQWGWRDLFGNAVVGWRALGDIGEKAHETHVRSLR